MESVVFFEGWQLHGRLHLIWSPHFLWITFSYSIHLFFSMRDDYYCKTISFLEKLVCFGWIRMIFRQDYWWQILLEYIINYLTNNMRCTRQLAIAAIIKWLQSILLLQPFFLMSWVKWLLPNFQGTKSWITSISHKGCVWCPKTVVLFRKCWFRFKATKHSKSFPWRFAWPLIAAVPNFQSWCALFTFGKG